MCKKIYGLSRFLTTRTLTDMSRSLVEFLVVPCNAIAIEADELHLKNTVMERKWLVTGTDPNEFHRAIGGPTEQLHASVDAMG